MTNKQTAQEINRTAKAIKKQGGSVDINWSLPTVAIDGILVPKGGIFGGSKDAEYLFQGESASELLAEAESAAEKFKVSVENYILWIAEGWG